MIKEAKNKMINSVSIKNVNEQTFFFSDYQLSITASSMEEAHIKLATILKDRAK